MNRFLVLLIVAFLVVAGFIFGINNFKNMHITAVFEELEPFPHNLNVYYKGFKLGHSVRVYPDKNFTNTHVDLALNAKGLMLPDNATAKVKRKDKKDYIELEYPNAPSVTYLTNHSIIQGKKGIDIAGYIDKQAEGGGLDEIKDNLNTTVQSAGETLDALTDLINTGNDILKDLRPSLKETGENLAEMSRNLAEVTGGLNSSAKPERLDNTFANIEQTTKNIERAAKNFESASLNISDITNHANKETITLIDCVIKNTNTAVNMVNTILKNANDIVKGFKVTLSRRFAGMRIILGTPISVK